MLVPCPLCGTQSAPGDSCTRCGTPIPAAAEDGSGYLDYWTGIHDKLRHAASPKYNVTGMLGYGGMAGVFLADEPRLGRRVAIKVLSPALMADQKLVERFTQEARTIAHLNHPNIVTIFEVDERDGLHWFAMSYVGGRTLGQVMMEATEPMPVDVTQAWLFQIADALSYAHDNGVVHRDIKPGNVLIDTRGNALVTDFGIAKLADTEAGLTRTGMLVGTPAYMSPEQCSSGHVTGASDQYSFGAVLYHMLTGRPPFAGPTLSVLQAHVSDEAIPILDLRPDCPQHLADAVHRMLAKHADDRWPSFAALIDATGAAPPGVADPIRGRLELLAAQATSIDVLDWNGTMAEGTAAPVRTVVRDAAGRELAGRRVVWRSSAPVVAAVSGAIGEAHPAARGVGAEHAADGDCLVKAYSPGAASLTADCGGGSITLEVTVTADPVQALSVSPEVVSLGADDQTPLDAIVVGADGALIDDRVVLWSSSDPTVAPVSHDGIVRGARVGDVAIVARTGGKTAAVRVNVTGTTTYSPQRTLRATRPAITPAPGQPGARQGAVAAAGISRAVPAVGATRLLRDRKRTAILAGIATIAVFGAGAAVMMRNGPSSANDAANSTFGTVPADTQPVSEPTLFSRETGAPVDTTGRQAEGTVPDSTAGAASPNVAADPPATRADAEPRTRDAAADQPQRIEPATIGIAGDLPAGATITVRDSNGRTQPVTGRSVRLPPGTYILEANAAGYIADNVTMTLRAGATQTWSPALTPVPPPPVPRPEPVRTQTPTPDTPVRPPPDTRADQAAVENEVRAFVAAFHNRNGGTVVPLLPQNRRGGYRQLLADTRNVSAFSVTLESMRPVRVQGDSAEVEFVVVVSFRNYNQENRVRHEFTGRAERGGTRWRLVSLVE